MKLIFDGYSIGISDGKLGWFTVVNNHDHFVEGCKQIQNGSAWSLRPRKEKFLTSDNLFDWSTEE